MRVVDGALVEVSPVKRKAVAAASTAAENEKYKKLPLSNDPSLWESTWDCIIQACAFGVDEEGEVASAMVDALIQVHNASKLHEIAPVRRFEELLALLDSLIPMRLPPGPPSGNTQIPH
jgi:hypothetical protein